MIDPKDFIPDPEGRKNHYVHPDLGLCALRDGMTLEEFIASLDEPIPELRRRVDRLTIIKRLDVLGLLDEAEAAILAAPALTRWRWNTATEGVYSDDPETIAFLEAIGANPDAILAP